MKNDILKDMFNDISYDINGAYDNNFIEKKYINNTRLVEDIRELIFDENKLQAEARKDILIAIIKHYICMYNDNINYDFNNKNCFGIKESEEN